MRPVDFQLSNFALLDYWYLVRKNSSDSLQRANSQTINPYQIYLGELSSKINVIYLEAGFNQNTRATLIFAVPEQWLKLGPSVSVHRFQPAPLKEPHTKISYEQLQNKPPVFPYIYGWKEVKGKTTTEVNRATWRSRPSDPVEKLNS